MLISANLVQGHVDASESQVRSWGRLTARNSQSTSLEDMRRQLALQRRALTLYIRELRELPTIDVFRATSAMPTDPLHESISSADPIHASTSPPAARSRPLQASRHSRRPSRCSFRAGSAGRARCASARRRTTSMRFASTWKWVYRPRTSAN